ncbi:MAG: FAD-dependent oxidoreductase [Burkholderiaceae bacterium]|jgi:NADH dehydrogenase FAD-containing subunit|nr:FAD-dependent oxidoreductase [Burkholderiaceae bacterium]
MTMHPSRKHLVLLGAGRVHLHILKNLAQQGAQGMNVTLAAPQSHYIEPAMLPGYVAGDYAAESISAPLAPLIEASGAGFYQTQVLSLDPVARRVLLSSGDALAYDVLSIDVGPAVERDRIESRMPGARHHALFTRPLENFLKLWPQLLALARKRALQVAVIGGALPGVELAMAAAQALHEPHGSRVTLLTDGVPLLPSLPGSLQRRILARLKTLNITVLQDHCSGIGAQALRLASGASLKCDAPILAICAGMPGWLRKSGVQISEAGEPVVNQRLQSESHRQIFVVPQEAPGEAAAALETNLRTAIGGGAFRKVPLDPPRLKIVTGGSHHAIAAWGPFSLEGREVWNWKARHERRQMDALFN